MQEQTRYRHEYKYEITYADYYELRARLGCLMQRDPHVGADGKYRIHSLYFDNCNDTALREKLDGVAKREKFRIRYYGDAPTQLSLEKKQKVNGLCLKVAAPIGATSWNLAGAEDFLGKLHDLLEQADHPAIAEAWVEAGGVQLRQSEAALAGDDLDAETERLVEQLPEQVFGVVVADRDLLEDDLALAADDLGVLRARAQAAVAGQRLGHQAGLAHPSLAGQQH